MIGNAIRQARKKLGMTQEMLGERIGVSAQAVSKWENDNALPDTAMLCDLADALSVSLDELFGRTAGQEEDVINSLYRYYAAQGGVSFDDVWRLLFHAYMLTWGGDRIRETPELLRDTRCQYWRDDGIAHAAYFAGRAFFVAAPIPKGGFGEVLDDNPEIRAMLTALGDADTYRAVHWLYGHEDRYRFLFPVLMRDAAIPPEVEETVKKNLEALRLIRAVPIVIDGKQQITYQYCQRFEYAMIWLMLRDSMSASHYNYQQRGTTVPLVKKFSSEP
ncbi:MAG: helix-turn-helix transcriptional regulator [Clostridia bacterium]|nr:helix-turn-helix transcriptional regulator [Clostridia bacterium]